MKMDLSLFEKIDTTPRNGSNMRDANKVKMYRKGHRTVIAHNLVADAGWKPGDKVDLYKFGQTYALKPSTSGCMKLSKPSGGNVNSRSLAISNQQLWLNTVPHTGDHDMFDAWVEDDVVFFKRTAENV